MSGDLEIEICNGLFYKVRVSALYGGKGPQYMSQLLLTSL